MNSERLIPDFKNQKFSLLSDSEMIMDPFFSSFLNSNNQRREVGKIQRIRSAIEGNSQKSKFEKKLKRKKIKIQSESVVIDGNSILGSMGEDKN